MPQKPTDNQSTLVQVMAWCRQATSYYLSQCWPRTVVSLGPNELNTDNWELVMMPTLSSLAVPLIAIMTACGAANDDKVGITATLDFQCRWAMMPVGSSTFVFFMFVINMVSLFG